MKPNLGRRVRAWRRAGWWTSGDLARAAGMHGSGLSRVEHGKQALTAAQAEAIVHALGLSMAEFYGRLP